MEYSLLWSKWQLPSLGITIPASLLSIPKWESASLTNTSKCRESFLHPIFSCHLKYISLAGCIALTVQKSSKRFGEQHLKINEGNNFQGSVKNITTSLKRWCSLHCLWLTFGLPIPVFNNMGWPCSCQSAHYSKHS